jgi:general nucleoside transport system ATP-binding protein
MSDASTQQEPATAIPTGVAVAMHGITKRFPGVVANDAVDFEAEIGEVHALLGENGAGKSTLSNILTGLYRPDEGEIVLYGEPVRFANPREALDAGIGMVHQHFRLVETFTVAENMALGEHRPGKRSSFRIDPGRIEAKVSELSDRYGMDVDPRARVWQLSLGEQQRVEILKALYRDARILILDEPTAVLTPQEAEVLFATLRQMVADGRTVIFISHKLNEVAAVSDRVTVLRGGRSVATVAMADATPRSLASLMVGRELADQVREARPDPGEPRLEVADLWVAGSRGESAVRGVSLVVRAGEIVAVAGVAGNGQRELAEAIAGLRMPERGTITVSGKALRLGDPQASLGAAIAFVPEDRMATGAAPGLSIASNLVLRSYRDPALSRGPLLMLGRIRVRAVRLIERYRIATPGPMLPARQLSGGNLQKVVIAREFSGNPRVVIAASPTQGLDVGATETVRSYLREAAVGGAAVLMFSEDLDEILELADRIDVIYEGAIAGEVPAGASIGEIGLLMAGGDAAAPSAAAGPKTGV